MKPVTHIVPILRDNYCFVIEGENRHCIIIDPGQVGPVATFIRNNDLVPELILNTHHHADHVAGNAELKALYKIPVIGPAAEMKLIPYIDKGLSDGSIVDQAGIRLHVIETPGHTLGHIAFHDKIANALFAGDTLFSMGCGRLLEGAPDQMYQSLQKIKSLPPETLLYCGHEYTKSNGDFALAVEPDNADVKTRMAEVTKLRANGLSTLPVSLETELKTNPFLRAESAEKFAELRLRKDNFN